jgi:hypothetical protein
MSAADIVKALGSRNGLARCPAHDDRTPSLSISDGGDGKILVKCHAGCGQGAVIDALRRLNLWPGEAREAASMTEAERERRRQQEVERECAERRRDAFIEALWRRTWEEAKPAPDSPIERWIAEVRGIDLSTLDLASMPLRWTLRSPRAEKFMPAMVALMTDPVTGEPCGIHRTYLLPDGSGKAPPEPSRMMLGRAGVIRLSPDVESGMCLGICEGIETGLAIMAAGGRPIWACGSLGGVENFPVLGGIDCIGVFADPKPHEIAGARSCAMRWADAGRQARLYTPPEGKDFNEAFRGLK